MQDKSSLNATSVDGCPGAQSAMAYQGSPGTCTKPGAFPKDKELRSRGGSRNFLGSSPPAAASIPPMWHQGCSATSASSWLCSERSCSHSGHRETHNSLSVGKTPYVALLQAEMALLPKMGMERCLCEQFIETPCVFPLWCCTPEITQPRPEVAGDAVVL